MKLYWQIYIDGVWVDGGAGRIDVVNPGTCENLPNTRWLTLAMWIAPCWWQSETICQALSDLRPVERGRMV